MSHPLLPNPNHHLSFWTRRDDRRSTETAKHSCQKQSRTPSSLPILALVFSSLHLEFASNLLCLRIGRASDISCGAAPGSSSFLPFCPLIAAPANRGRQRGSAMGTPIGVRTSGTSHLRLLTNKMGVQTPQTEHANTTRPATTTTMTTRQTLREPRRPQTLTCSRCPDGRLTSCQT